MPSKQQQRRVQRREQRRNATLPKSPLKDCQAQQPNRTADLLYNEDVPVDND